MEKKLIARSIFVRLPTDTLWEDVKCEVETKLQRVNITDEIVAIVCKRYGWEITFGKLSTADELMGSFMFDKSKVKGYVVSAPRSNYLHLTLSKVSPYIPDEEIVNELEKIESYEVVDMERIRVDGIETGERKVAVISDSIWAPESIIIKFEDGKELIPVTYRRHK